MAFEFVVYFISLQTYALGNVAEGGKKGVVIREGKECKWWKMKLIKYHLLIHPIQAMYYVLMLENNRVVMTNKQSS